MSATTRLCETCETPFCIECDPDAVRCVASGWHCGGCRGTQCGPCRDEAGREYREDVREDVRLTEGGR